MAALAAASVIMSVLSMQAATATMQKPTRLAASNVNHKTHRAKMESVVLAAQLVPVPGYRYADPSSAEVNAFIERLKQYENQLHAPKFFAAASFHSVVAKAQSQNRSATASGSREVGFLQLYAFGEAPPADLATNRQFFSAQHDGKSPKATLQMSGTTVFVFEYPNEPNSRFQYAWLRHGISANFDGASRGPLERWLRLYLAAPNPSPGETPALAARLVPVTGFAYVNYPSPQLTKTAVTPVFGNRKYSIHKIVDSSGLLAGLILISVPSSMSTSDAFASYAKAYPKDFSAPTSLTIAGIPLDKVASGTITSYIWAAGGVVGNLTTENPAQAERFLAGLLSGWGANGWK